MGQAFENRRKRPNKGSPLIRFAPFQTKTLPGFVPGRGLRRKTVPLTLPWNMMRLFLLMRNDTWSWSLQSESTSGGSGDTSNAWEVGLSTSTLPRGEGGSIWSRREGWSFRRAPICWSLLYTTPSRTAISVYSSIAPRPWQGKKWGSPKPLEPLWPKAPRRFEGWTGMSMPSMMTLSVASAIFRETRLPPYGPRAETTTPEP